jgi:hypothetical protein
VLVDFEDELPIITVVDGLLDEVGGNGATYI